MAAFPFPHNLTHHKPTTLVDAAELDPKVWEFMRLPKHNVQRQIRVTQFFYVLKSAFDLVTGWDVLQLHISFLDPKMSD